MDERKALAAGQAYNAAHTMDLTPNMRELRRTILVNALELHTEDELEELRESLTFAFGAPARVELDAELARARAGITRPHEYAQFTIPSRGGGTIIVKRERTLLSDGELVGWSVPGSSEWLTRDLDKVREHVASGYYALVQIVVPDAGIELEANASNSPHYLEELLVDPAPPLERHLPNLLSEVWNGNAEHVLELVKTIRHNSRNAAWLDDLGAFSRELELARVPLRNATPLDPWFLSNVTYGITQEIDHARKRLAELETLAERATALVEEARELAETDENRALVEELSS